jgi:hypothetical protein
VKLRDIATLKPRTDQITAALTDVVTPLLPYGSPYATSEFNRIIFEDIIGAGVTPTLSRAQAMKIPAVARGRNLMVSTICRWVLKAADERGVLTTQPAWMYATAGPTHPAIRLAWTVDDLIFYGWSLWSRDPATLLPSGRIDRARWYINADHRIVVDGIPQREDQVILFPGLHEGILEYGRDTLTDTKDLYAMVRSRIKNPVPLLDLHDTSDAQLEDDEIDALIGRWAKARNGENGGVAYTNKSVELNELGGGGDAQLLIEARNAAAVDMARIVGVSASKVDATSPKASLNYETSEGRNLEFVDTDTDLYVTPITARLSMDDILPSGQSAVLDKSDFIGLAPSPTGPQVQD